MAVLEGVGETVVGVVKGDSESITRATALVAESLVPTPGGAATADGGRSLRRARESGKNLVEANRRRQKFLRKTNSSDTSVRVNALQNAQASGSQSPLISTTDGEATVTISDDDTPILRVADVTLDEGAGTAVFLLTLSSPSRGDARIDFTTVAESAAAGSDFEAAFGSVIDELPGPGHPGGNIHTSGSPSRHPGPSVFRSMEGGETLRRAEIRAHWRAKGSRMVEIEPGVWIDPGP